MITDEIYCIDKQIYYYCYNSNYHVSLDLAHGDKITDFVKNGWCVISLKQELIQQEWKNQRKERAHYFHKFPIFKSDNWAGWSMLSTSPYLHLFHLKYVHMEQAGIIAKLAKQYSLLKREESEELEPLKLEHFYIILIGIVCGLFLALFSFVVEKMSKNICKNLWNV